MKYTARQAINYFDPNAPSFEDRKIAATLACYNMLARYLVKIINTRLTVTYTIEVIPHEYDEHSKYIQITANVQ